MKYKDFLYYYLKFPKARFYSIYFSNKVYYHFIRFRFISLMFFLKFLSYTVLLIVLNFNFNNDVLAYCVLKIIQGDYLYSIFLIISFLLGLINWFSICNIITYFIIKRVYRWIYASVLSKKVLNCMRSNTALKQDIKKEMKKIRKDIDNLKPNQKRLHALYSKTLSEYQSIYNKIEEIDFPMSDVYEFDIWNTETECEILGVKYYKNPYRPEFDVSGENAIIDFLRFVFHFSKYRNDLANRYYDSFTGLFLKQNKDILKKRYIIDTYKHTIYFGFPLFIITLILMYFFNLYIIDTFIANDHTVRI